jgi:phosphoglycerol transferase MdoB-like AlkP superfamily enzyme
VSHALAKTGADGPIRSKHQPMRLFIPEGDFQPEPLLEVPPGPGRPNILIVNLESVNATYFSSYGIRPGVEMENFDALRESRLVGMRYHSVLGGSSHGNDWAMLTSLYAPSFGPTPFSGDRSIQQKNLLYYGKRAGYRTGFFTTDFTAYREFYKLFKHPDCDVFYDKKSPELGPLPKDLTLEEQMAQLLFEGIDATDDQPFLFLYRTNNAHWPYDSRQADETMSPLERYKHAILENDRVLGEIISGLKQRGLFENTIILVTGDHGESFQEHENLSMHSGGVYEELVHVPFLISYPAHIHRQMRIQENTSHLDILPTLLDLAGLGIEDFDELEGYSLIRTLPPGRMLFVVNGDDGAVNGVI